MPNVTVYPYNNNNYNYNYGTVPFDNNAAIMSPLLPSHIKQPPSTWQRFCRLLVVIVCILLCTAAVALGFLAHKISTTMEINPDASHSVEVVLWITSGVTGGIFLIGCLGAATGFRPVLCCFSFLLFPLLAAFVTAGVMVLLLDGAVSFGDSWKHDTEGIWKDLVKASNADDQHFLCQIQQKFTCSGFDLQQPGSGCCIPDLCYNSAAPPSWVAQYCPSNCVITNINTDTCYGKFQSDVHKYVVAACFVCFGGAGLLLCVCLISICLVCKRDRRLERINEYEYLSVPI